MSRSRWPTRRAERSADSRVGTRLRHRIQRLRANRKRLKAAKRRKRIGTLTRAERKLVRAKTNGRCHLCGGGIRGRWNADHIEPHSHGGEHSVTNYLPAHGTCNNYRWDYLADEFELILKLGVWARTQVELWTRPGALIAEEFSKHDRRRRARGGKPRSNRTR